MMPWWDTTPFIGYDLFKYVRSTRITINGMQKGLSNRKKFNWLQADGYKKERRLAGAPECHL